MHEMHNVGNWRYMPDAKKVVFVGHCWMTDNVEVFNFSGTWFCVLDLNHRNVTTSNTNLAVLFSVVLLHFVDRPIRDKLLLNASLMGYYNLTSQGRVDQIVLTDVISNFTLE